ncbi:uncharacterized protein [Miscanthus floridulus]|uniref:uncharacterized protein n=1 Tax=Miscanthus floridulus TaxID=154761 RepID=UPI003459FC1D
MPRGGWCVRCVGGGQEVDGAPTAAQPQGPASRAGRRLASGPPAEAGPASLPHRARLDSLGPAQHRAAPGLPPRACPRRAASCPDRVRARSPRGRPALATPAARQPRPGSTSTRAPSSAPQRCLLPITPPALSAAEQQQQLPPARNTSSPPPPPLPRRQHTPPTPPFPIHAASSSA